MSSDVELWMAKRYPMVVQLLKEEDGDEYYFGFLPDFGYSVCSATGHDIDELFFNLEAMKWFVLEHYLSNGKKIPEPSSYEAIELVKEQVLYTTTDAQEYEKASYEAIELVKRDS